MRIFDVSGKRELLNVGTRTLAGAELTGANLSGAALRGADLRRASLRWARLDRADLRGANLRRANLTSANLTGADLSSADLLNANLETAMYDADTRWPSGFAPAFTSAFPISSESALALSELHPYAREHGLALRSVLYHDVPMFSLAWKAGPYRNRISVAANAMLDTPELQATMYQWVKARFRRPPANPQWRSLPSLTLGFNWAALHAALEAARKELNAGPLET
ncbi:MAG TPA: pentapeptide repeat-containing protein [Armatimonadota bacterium]|jgi:uncharacterized protein YjbI with pentapeptide repeats